MLSVRHRDCVCDLSWDDQSRRHQAAARPSESHPESPEPGRGRTMIAARPLHSRRRVQLSIAGPLTSAGESHSEVSSSSMGCPDAMMIGEIEPYRNTGRAPGPQAWVLAPQSPRRPGSLAAAGRPALPVPVPVARLGPLARSRSRWPDRRTPGQSASGS
jgi:hypothetical protein